MEDLAGHDELSEHDEDEEDIDENDEEDDDDAIREHVAACPITPGVVEQVVAVADLSPDETEELEAAMERLGFLTDGLEVDEARFRTPEGHLVYGDFCLAMPFAYSYAVGGELNPEDFWGTLPGWSSVEDAGRADLDAHVDAAVTAFAQVLGPPELDIRTSSRASSGGHVWRYAAWRRGGNVLVVGQGLDGFSYNQNEEALVFVGELAEDAPFPDASTFEDFMTW